MSSKFLADCENTKNLADKFVIVTKSAGQDYKVSMNNLQIFLEQTMLREMLQTRLGEISPNLNPKHSGQDSYQTKYLEYLQCNGQQIKKVDYPNLFTALGIQEEYYKLPDFNQGGGCTLRHTDNGSGRALGGYQSSAFAKHSHIVPEHTHIVPSWKININEIASYNSWNPNTDGTEAIDGHVTAKVRSADDGLLNSDNEKYTHVIWRTNFQYANNERPTKLSDKVTSEDTGDIETRTANIAVQFYMVAKVLV